jgi:FixJ family two-component response regulator
MDEAVVYIVDDDEHLCAALSSVIGKFHLKTSIYHTAEEFLVALPLSNIGCILLDIRMGKMSGLELQQELTNKGCQLPIIFLTGHATIRMAVQAVKLGAFEFLEKPFDNDRLVKLVQSAINQSRKTDKAAHKLDVLTNGEREIFDKLVQGKTNKEIANENGLSIRTVEFHRRNIKDKTSSTTLADLINLANSGDK